MTISNAELNKKKKLAEQILENKSVKLNDFLGEAYQKVIDDNFDLLVELVETSNKKEKEKKQKPQIQPSNQHNQQQGKGGTSNG